jgi:hypothetical protein
MAIKEQEVRDAIRFILSDTSNYAKSLNCAVGYCQIAMKQEGESLRVQCLYILNTITHWRNPKASAVRNVLKGFVKQNG